MLAMFWTSSGEKGMTPLSFTASCTSLCLSQIFGNRGPETNRLLRSYRAKERPRHGPNFSLERNGGIGEHGRRS